MNPPVTGREALLIEALGDVAQLLDRVEPLLASLEKARKAVLEVEKTLDHRAVLFQAQTNDLAAKAAVRIVDHVTRRANEITQQAMEDWTKAMAQVAHRLVEEEAGATLRQLAQTLHQLLDRNRRWDHWLTYASVAIWSSGLTWTLIYLAHR